jgi:hypothetical protein
MCSDSLWMKAACGVVPIELLLALKRPIPDVPNA